MMLSSKMHKLPPPIVVTEDTPPDMLSGSMDLYVVLPNKKSMKVNVDRSTPMLDILVQITTANKMSPGNYSLQAFEESGVVLPYKPSTPIGTLDPVSIHIVPKNSGNVSVISSKPAKPFEKTFRIQVHLPHNQLYVLRTNGSTKLSEVLNQICEQKNLDSSKYSLTHPVNTSKILNTSKTIADYSLQQLALVPNCDRPIGVSTADIIGLKTTHERCDGSLSSGSLGGRSLSPARSDASTESPPQPVMPLQRPTRKRRPAPKPPILQSQSSVSSSGTSDSNYIISHSRNSSDSSGYHEASLLSASPESNSLPDSLPRRSKLTHHSNSNTNFPTKFKMSQSCTNLNATASGSTSNLYKKSNLSASTVSLSSAGARKKKPAPPPPAQNKMSALPEEKVQTLKSTKISSFGIDEELKRKSSTLPPAFSSPSPSSNVEPSSPCFMLNQECDKPRISSTQTCINVSISSKVPQPKPRTKLNSSFVNNEVPLRNKRRAPSPPKRIVNIYDDTKSNEENVNNESKQNIHYVEVVLHEPPVLQRQSSKSELELQFGARNNVDTSKIAENVKKTDEKCTNKTAILACQKGNAAQECLDNDELKMDDDEIDRIFNNATKDYETVSYTENSEEPESLHWEYKLPTPPSAFRDMNQSPTLTEFDTVTIGNLTEMIATEIKIEEKLVNRKEVMNDSSLTNDNISKTPIKFANEMIVSVTIENDYKKYDRDDDCADGKNSFTGNDSGLELDDSGSKSYENEEQTKPRVVKSSSDSKSYSTPVGIDNYNRRVHNGIKNDHQFTIPDNFTTKNNLMNGSSNHKYKFYDEMLGYDSNIQSNVCHKFDKKDSKTEDVNLDLMKLKCNQNKMSADTKNNENVKVDKNTINNERGCKEINIINKENKDEKENKLTHTKSAIINELSGYIKGERETTSAVKVNDTIVKPTKTSKSPNPTSSLVNFQISSYENIKRPISIYCDESVVVSTKPKNPKTPSPISDSKPYTSFASKVNRHNSFRHVRIDDVPTPTVKVNRHNSLRQDRPDMSSAMKRSSSYISLLSNPVKFNLKRFDKFFSTSTDRVDEVPKLRRSTSEFNIDKEDNSSIIKFKESRRDTWKRSVNDVTTDLQSLQVMKSILPQLTLHEESNREREESNITTREDETTSNNEVRKFDNENITEEVKPFEEELKEVKPRDEIYSKRYSYQGTPNIDFTTWNERTKSLERKAKDDNNAIPKIFKDEIDETINKNDFIYNKHIVNSMLERNIEKLENKNITMRLVSQTKSHVKPFTPFETIPQNKSPHAPIVRAVELKKPPTFNKPPKVTRPKSFYFGEKLDCFNNNNNNETNISLSERDMLLQSIRSFGRHSLKKID